MKSTVLTSPPEPSKTIAQTRSTRLARHSTRPTAHPPPNNRPAQPLNQRSHQTRLTATKPETTENSKSREPPHPRETTETANLPRDQETNQKRSRIPQEQPTCCYPRAADQTPPKKGHSRTARKRHLTTRDIIK